MSTEIYRTEEPIESPSLILSIDTYLFDLMHLSVGSETVVSNGIINTTRFITHLGDGVLLAFISICFLAVLISKKQNILGLYWTAIIVFSYILCAGLKTLIDRERPDDLYHLIEASSPALPSGHALKSTVVYIGLYILISRLFTLSGVQKKWIKLLFVFPFAIGMSRILLGVHWPSDIIMGWGVGLIICNIFLVIRPSLNLIRQN